MANVLMLAGCPGHLDLVGEADVLALRPDLYMLATRRFPAGRVKDLSDLVSPRAAQAAGARSLRASGAFIHASRQEGSGLEACGMHELNRTLHLHALLDALLAAAGRRYDEIRIPEGWTGDASWRTWSEATMFTALRAAALQHARRGVRIRLGDRALPSGRLPRRRLLVRALRAAAGRLVLGLLRRAPALVADAPPGPALPRGEVLVAGLQATDSVLQTALVPRLVEAFPGLCWLRQRQAAVKLAEDEQALLRAEGQPLAVEASSFPVWTWRRPAYRTLAAAAQSLAAARALIRRPRAGSVPLDLDLLQDLLLETLHLDAPLGIARWRAALAGSPHRLVIGNSLVAGMGPFAEAAREAGRALLLIPHGGAGEVTIQYYQVASADYAMALGREYERVYRGPSVYPGPRAVRRIGNFFLGVEPMPAVDPAERRHVLFLETNDFTLPLQTSSGALWRVLELTARAAAAAGGTASFRPHPRLETRSYYDRVAGHLRAAGLPAMLDPESSVWAALARARCVVSASFDTSCLKAMMAGVPVLFHNPWPAWYPSERTMRRIMGRSLSADELVETVRALEPGSEAARAWLARQQAFVQEFIDADPPAPAERLVAFVRDILNGQVP